MDCFDKNVKVAADHAKEIDDALLVNWGMPKTAKVDGSAIFESRDLAPLGSRT